MAYRPYEHQQTEPKVVYLYAVGLGLATALAWFVWGPLVSGPAFAFGGLYLLFARAPFLSMLTGCTRETLTIQYWLGWPRRTIPMERVRAAREVKNPSWSARGGAHRIWSDGLWSYSVWGVDAIEVTYTDDRGEEAALRVGTDDVKGLLAAIEANRP